MVIRSKTLRLVILISTVLVTIIIAVQLFWLHQGLAARGVHVLDDDLDRGDAHAGALERSPFELRRRD